MDFDFDAMDFINFGKDERIIDMKIRKDKKNLKKKKENKQNINNKKKKHY